MTTHLILGGQKSGKSRLAEDAAVQWLADAPARRAVLLATAQGLDGEMQQRIARHQADRAERLPALQVQPVPLYVAQAIARYSRPGTLLIVDCLTLWLTNWLMPAADGAMQSAQDPKNHPNLNNIQENMPFAGVFIEELALLLIAIKAAPGPVVLVSNEIGSGVIPLGQQVRAFVDALGKLNQDVARACDRVTLMAAGLPLVLKAAA